MAQPRHREIGEVAEHTVDAGCVVGIRYQGDAEDEVEKYLYGSIEERREGLTVMSPGSPLGEALFGAKVGHVVKYLAPGGESSVEVVSIEA